MGMSYVSHGNELRMSCDELVSRGNELRIL